MGEIDNDRGADSTHLGGIAGEKGPPMLLAIDTTDHEAVKELSRQVSQARAWMLRHCAGYLNEDGRVDIKSLAEQAQWEYCLDGMTAEDLAAQVAAEVDN